MTPWAQWINRQLSGQAEVILTWGLVMVAALLIAVAIWGPPAAKAGFLAWVVAP